MFNVHRTELMNAHGGAMYMSWDLPVVSVPDDQSYVQNGDASSFLGLSSQGQNDLLGEEVDGQTDLLGGDVGGLSGPVTPQQGGDPMTDSFIDMNTLNSNAARDPMTQSFIDESTSVSNL